MLFRSYDLLYKLWEGLGYYSRVRNMKKAAQMIMDKYDGEFPHEYVDVLSLPGIGPYTAGAICSIAFGMKTPAVDGNVLRVASRLTNDTTPIDSPKHVKQIQLQLSQIYPDKAGAFTQALMELGATVCGPNRKPECNKCPCNSFCMAHLAGTAEKLPIKSPKRSKKNEDMTVFVLRCGDRYALEKRSSKGLLAGMWQFPNVSGKRCLDEGIDILADRGCRVTSVSMTIERKHVFTHVQWNMAGVYLDVAKECEGYTWMTAKQINEEAGLPTAFRMFWDELGRM